MSENVINTNDMGIPDTETVEIESSAPVSEAPIIKVLGGEQEAPIGETPIIDTTQEKKPRSKRARANRTAEPATMSESVVEAPLEAIEPAKRAKPEKVAVYTNHPVYWPEVGRLSKGYNLVNQDVADKWIARGWARLATPEEVAKAFGV